MYTPLKKGMARNKKLLGGKGAGLCEMTQIGLNVPPGFVISTEACLAYLDSGNSELPDGLMETVEKYMAELEVSDWKKIRGSRESAFGFSQVRFRTFDAGNDGHDSQPWTEFFHLTWAYCSDRQ